uniref:ZAD domain-containing protein n=1 Tax=Anopheles atroparvus TaxID=41427 RepID=A0AAG5DIF8_ANOAO
METEEIWIPAVQPSAALCRICVLPDDGDITLINQPMNEHDGTNSLQIMLEKLFPSVFSDEHLRSEECINWPTLICQGCKRKVKDTYGLYELCVASTERLRKMLSEEFVLPDVLGSESDTDFLLQTPAEDWIKKENVSEVLNRLPPCPNLETSAQGLIKSEEDSEESTIARNSPTAKKSRAPRKLKTTSNEDRKRIVLAFERGTNVATIAERLNIKRGTVYSVIRKFQNTMRVESDKRGNLLKKKITQEISEQIRGLIKSGEDSEESTISRNSPTAKKSRAPRKLKTTSNEDRERIVLAFERGTNVATIAERLNIKRGTVYSVIRKYQNTRRVEADKRGKLINKKITPEISEQIRGLIKSGEDSEESTISRNSPTAKKSRAPRKLKTTSNEDRKRIVLAFERGTNVATIAERLNIKRGTVYSVIRKYQNTRRVESDKRGKQIKKKITPEISERIRAWIAEDCTLSLGKLAQNILEQYQVQVSPSTIAKEIGDFNYSLKRIDLHPERKTTENKSAERKEYATSLTAILCRVPESNIIFLTEVGFNVSLRVMRRFGKGSEAGKIIPHLRVRNISVVCAMHTGGILHYMPRNRLIDKDFFVLFLKELFEKLSFANLSPAVIVMENVALHKCEEVMALFEHSPYEMMYLPPHSSFLNPVETLFNNFKEICKRANPESEEEVITDIENGNNLITASDCNNYFKHMWEIIPRCLREEQIDD